MQILVLYYSKTGHTRNLADAIAKGAESVSGITVLLKDTDSVKKDDFIQSDAIIAGSPVYFGTMAWPLKKVMDEFVSTRPKMQGKVGAAFATSADPSGGKETTIMSIIQALLIYGMVIVGDPLSATGHYGTSCAGAPNKETLKNGEKLGTRVAEIVLKLRS